MKYNLLLTQLYFKAKCCVQCLLFHQWYHILWH